MDPQIEQQIEEGIKAIAELKRKHGDEIGEVKDQMDGIAERFKTIEQELASGAIGASMGGGQRAPGLADQITASDAFKSFKAGETKVAGIPLTDLSLKNTIVADSGSPPTPSDTLSPAQRVAGAVMGAQRQLRIRDLLTVLPATSNLIEFTREASFSNAAAPQSYEGADKPESALTFELKETKIATIATFLKASKQSLDDSGWLYNYLDTRLRYAIALAEEQQLLLGDGTGSNLSGLATEAATFTPTTGDSKLDCLRRAIAELESSDYPPSGIVLNPGDWFEIETAKDDRSRYIFANPQNSAAPQLWGLPVVVTPTMTSGTFLLGNFGLAAVLWDRQQAMVEFFEQDSDNVTKNLVTIRAEERVGLSVFLPAALRHGTFL